MKKGKQLQKGVRFYVDNDNQQILILWPKKGKEEKAVAVVREMFEDSDVNTDRCWSQNEQTKRLGTRIYLGKVPPQSET